MKQARGLLLTLLVVALGYVPAVNAALLFENFDPVVVGAPGNIMPVRGTQFTVGPESLSVTKLGTFAVASSDMMVGIWRVSDQSLVGSVSVPQLGGTLDQGWHFASVTPFTLFANTVYRIGAQTEFGTVAWGTYQRGSGIASVSAGHVYSDIPGFMYPSAGANAALFAANAEIAPIPEPSSYALLLAGLAGLLFAYRRRENEGRVTTR